ncbi:MAG: hypothetical protein WD467_03800 [Candidatus Saccharimonadales bacterium]
MKRRILVVTVLTLFLGLAWNHQAVVDWWFLRSYDPPQEVETLADSSYFSETGRRLFYLSDPAVNDKQEFNINCPIFEKSYVLGCYSQQRIYILEVERQELEGIMEVTAAHEMLHAAYDRLSTRERDRVVEQLEAAYADIDNDKLRSLIRSYEETGGESVRQNELHSIMATQVIELPNEIETYYGQYFSDRQAVAEIYAEYEGVFSELNRDIDRLQAEVTAVRDQLASLEDQIVTTRAEVDGLNREMSRLEDEGEIAAYNQLVPRQNAAVDRYNGYVDQYRGLVSRHNQLVDGLNRTVLLQKDLVNSLDSKFESL